MDNISCFNMFDPVVGPNILKQLLAMESVVIEDKYVPGQVKNCV